MSRLLLVLVAASVLVLAVLVWRRLSGRTAAAPPVIGLRASELPVPVPVLEAASVILVNMALKSFRKPDGYSLDELLEPRDPRDRDLAVAPPAGFAGAMNFLLATGAVAESGGRFLPSPAGQAAVDGLYPRVGLDVLLEQSVRAYLRSQPLGAAGARFAPDDEEIRTAYAVYGAWPGFGRG